MKIQLIINRIHLGTLRWWAGRTIAPSNDGIHHLREIQAGGRHTLFYTIKAVSLQFPFPGPKADHPAGGIGDLKHPPGLPVDTPLKVKGSADIGLAFSDAIAHSTYQCKSCGA